MNKAEVMKLIDISCVKGIDTVADIDRMIEFSYEHHPKCLFALPAFTPYLAQQLEKRGKQDLLLGGTMGFPAGAELTAIKVMTVKKLKKLGCDEFDMVINVGALKSGLYKEVYKDIKAVVNAAEGHTTKCILEVTRLTDDEIKRGSELAVKAGITFVKTGTGWMNAPSTVEHVKLIKQTIGDSASIKAAGGIRDLATMRAMIDAGCTRFGIGLSSCQKILAELESVGEL